MFNKNGEILDIQDEDYPDASGTHAAYFTYDNKALLVANMSNGIINYIYLNNNKFGDQIRFSVRESILNLPEEKKNEWPESKLIKPITAKPLDMEKVCVTLSCGGCMILNITDPEKIKVEYLVIPKEMPSAGLLSYYDNKKQNLYVNHGVGTGSTSTGSHSALYCISFDKKTNKWSNPKTIYKKDKGDSHGMVVNKNELCIVDRDLNILSIVNLKNQCYKDKQIYDIKKRDIGMDLIIIGETNLYTSNRGSQPLSGNNTKINNAKGTQAGVSLIDKIIT